MGWQDNLLFLTFILFCQPFKQEAGSLTPHLIRRLRCNRQKWRHHQRFGQIIEAYNRNIVRYLDPRIIQRFKDTDRNKVIGTKNRGWDADPSRGYFLLAHIRWIG